MTRVDEMLDYLESLLNEIIVLEKDYPETKEELSSVYSVATIIMAGMLSNVDLLTEEQFHRSQDIVKSYQSTNPRYFR